MLSLFKKLRTKASNPVNLREDILDTIKNELQNHLSLGKAIPLVQIDNDGAVFIVLEIDASKKDQWDKVTANIKRAVEEQHANSLKSTTIALSAHIDCLLYNKQATRSTPKQAHAANAQKLEHVKRVIMIASGKGGVGKSTVTANLAIALNAQGKRVGIMDADIYGPSQPRMMGIDGQKPDGSQGQIIPLNANDVRVMSIGLMVDPDAALVWRGPIVQKALMQLMFDVEWGTKEDPLDILLIDMPPGTGDVQLTLSQKIQIDSAVIVSTPQDIALIDARRGISMFNKVNIPILGIIENMSTHICSACGHEDHIFGHDGAKKEAEKLNVAFLGEIPLKAEIREQADTGEIRTSAVYADIASRLTKDDQAS